MGVSVLSVETISFTPRPSRVETGRFCRWASANQEYCEIKPIRPTNGTVPRGVQVLTKSKSSPRASNSLSPTEDHNSAFSRKKEPTTVTTGTTCARASSSAITVVP